MSTAKTNPQRFRVKWEMKRLGELGPLIKGRGMKHGDVSYEGLPGIRCTELYTRYQDCILKVESRIPPSVAETALPIKTGDLLFAASGTTPEEIGRCAAYLGKKKAHVGRNIIVLTPSGQNSIYLGHLMNHPIVSAQKARMGRGGFIVYISTNNLAQVQIELPPIVEQNAIVEVLSDVDGLLNTLEALIAKKQTIKQAVVRQLLTGKTRLSGFSGAWETKRLGEIASFFKGLGLSKADLLLDGKRRCIHYGELFKTYGECITEVVHGTDRDETFFSSLSNDVLMPGSSVTPNGLATASCISIPDVILGGNVLVIRVPTDILNGIFLAYVIRMNHSQVMQLVSGTTVCHLYARDMANFTFVAPSVEEQNAIVSVFSDMDAEIVALEQRRDKTRAIKQMMMQQLLTGRVRLIKKKYTKMLYQKSPYFQTPQKCEKIWRYMPIDKFMAMLSEESLYFPNVYSFDDRYEGCLSEKTREKVYKTNLLNEKNTPVQQDEGFIREKKKYREWHGEHEVEKILNRFHSFQTLLQDFSNHLMFCSSWFLNGNESHSMWAEYGDKRSSTSVAIQTTVGDLIQSFESTSYQIHIGKVKYKNYNEEHIEGYENFLSEDLKNPNDVLKLFYAPILHKRDIYKDEKEVRAIVSFESICKNHLGRIYASDIPFYSDRLFKEDFRYFSADQTNIMKDIPKGISVKINLQTLLKAIVISPNANEYFYKPLINLIKNYNIDPSIVRPSAI